MNSTSRNFRKQGNVALGACLGGLLLLLTGAAPSSDWSQQFTGANDLYKQGRWEEAASAYETLLSQGAVGASLYYNLGNSYFKQGKIGRAVLAYERASRLAPKDKEILGNLAYAKEFVQDKVSGAESSLWVRRLRYLYELLTLNMTAGVSSFSYFLLTLVLCVMIVRPALRRELRRWVIVSSVCLGFSLALLGAKLLSERYAQAIIVAREVDVRYGPSAQETKAFVLHEGTQISIREIAGDWVLIWLPNDRGGWIQRENLEPI